MYFIARQTSDCFLYKCTIKMLWVSILGTFTNLDLSKHEHTQQNISSCDKIVFVPNDIQFLPFSAEI